MDEMNTVVTEAVEETVMEAVAKKPVKGGLIGGIVAGVAVVGTGAYFAIRHFIGKKKTVNEAEGELTDDFDDDLDTEDFDQ